MAVRNDGGSRGLFVLTSDLDWASEYCVAAFLELARDYGIVPTLFVTHQSEAAAAAARAGRCELGIHPNFLPNSSHGASVDAVIRHVLELVPEPVATRSHAYADSSAIAMALVGHGLRVDSNLCLHLQEELPPLRHWSGLLRLPVFFEDDVHWHQGREWSFAPYRAAFRSDGLKILNFHPFMTALNSPDQAFHEANKRHIPSLDAATAAVIGHRGPGAATFLREALEGILADGGRFVTLGQLARLLTTGTEA